MISDWIYFRRSFFLCVCFLNKSSHLNMCALFAYVCVSSRPTWSCETCRWLQIKSFKRRALLMSINCCDSQAGLPPLCLPSLSLLNQLYFLIPSFWLFYTLSIFTSFHTHSNLSLSLPLSVFFSSLTHPCSPFLCFFQSP